MASSNSRFARPAPLRINLLQLRLICAQAEEPSENPLLRSRPDQLPHSSVCKFILNDLAACTVISNYLEAVAALAERFEVVPWDVMNRAARDAAFVLMTVHRMDWNLKRSTMIPTFVEPVRSTMYDFVNNLVYIGRSFGGELADAAFSAKHVREYESTLMRLASRRLGHLPQARELELYDPETEEREYQFGAARWLPKTRPENLAWRLTPYLRKCNAADGLWPFYAVSAVIEPRDEYELPCNACRVHAWTVRLLPCGHRVCSTCVAKACPMCSAPVSLFVRCHVQLEPDSIDWENWKLREPRDFEGTPPTPLEAAHRPPSGAQTPSAPPMPADFGVVVDKRMKPKKPSRKKRAMNFVLDLLFA